VTGAGVPEIGAPVPVVTPPAEPVFVGGVVVPLPEPELVPELPESRAGAGAGVGAGAGAGLGAGARAPPPVGALPPPGAGAGAGLAPPRVCCASAIAPNNNTLTSTTSRMSQRVDMVTTPDGLLSNQRAGPLSDAPAAMQAAGGARQAGSDRGKIRRLLTTIPTFCDVLTYLSQCRETLTLS
jgi:hypothetical protein